MRHAQVTSDLMMNPVGAHGAVKADCSGAGKMDASAHGPFHVTLRQVAYQGEGAPEMPNSSPVSQESDVVDATPSETKESAEAILIQALLAGVVHEGVASPGTNPVPVSPGEEASPTSGDESTCAPCGEAVVAVTERVGLPQTPDATPESTAQAVVLPAGATERLGEAQLPLPAQAVDTAPKVTKHPSPVLPNQTESSSPDPLDIALESFLADNREGELPALSEANAGIAGAAGASVPVVEVGKTVAQIDPGPLRVEHSQGGEMASLPDAPVRMSEGASAEGDRSGFPFDRESDGQSPALHSSAAAHESGAPNGMASSSGFPSVLQSADAVSRAQPTRAIPQPVPAPWEVTNPSVRLEVAPGDGAPVQVHVSLVNHTVYARVVTGQPEVQDFLARNHTRLETQLQQHGLEIGSFVVDSGQHQSGRSLQEWAQPAPTTQVRALKATEPAEASSGPVWTRQYRLNVVA